MGGRGKLLCTEEFQLINWEECRRNVDHHEANTTEILASVNVLRWMLKPVGKCLRINRIFVESQSLSPKIFIIMKGENSDCRVEKSSRHQLNQLIKVDIAINKLYRGMPGWLSW